MARGMGDYRLHRHQANAPTGIKFDIPVLLYEHFEGAVWNWTNSGNPAGWSAGFSPNAAYFEDAGGRLQTTGAGPALGDWVQIERDVIVSDAPEAAFSIVFRLVNPLVQFRYLIMRVERQVFGVLGTASIRYDCVLAQWEVDVFGVGWVVFLERSFLGANHWHRGSFFNDAAVGNYGLFQVDSTVVDLSQFMYPLVMGFADERTTVSLRVEAAGANQVTLDLDNIILRHI